MKISPSCKHYGFLENEIATKRYIKIERKYQMGKKIGEKELKKVKWAPRPQSIKPVYPKTFLSFKLG